MAKKNRAHDDEAWRNAKKICRLNARQIEMARALGMNPKKLPGLRPSPQERWKLPVGAFIEDRYWKRFGGGPLDHDRQVQETGSRKPSTTPLDGQAPERVSDVASQVADLACYLTNLADDLQKWLSSGSIDPEVLAEVREELRGIVAALDTGSSIYAIPGITLPPRPARSAASRRGSREGGFDEEIPDDEIPF